MSAGEARAIIATGIYNSYHDCPGTLHAGCLRAIASYSEGYMKFKNRCNLSEKRGSFYKLLK